MSNSETSWGHMGHSYAVIGPASTSVMMTMIIMTKNILPFDNHYYIIDLLRQLKNFHGFFTFMDSK